MIFARALEALLHTGVAPQSANRVANLRGDAVTLDLCRLHEDGLNVVLVASILQGKLQGFHSLQDNPH